jgi:hypothetical protein
MQIENIFGIEIDTTNEKKIEELQTRMRNLSRSVKHKINMRTKTLKRNNRHKGWDDERFRLSQILDDVEHSVCHPTSSLEQWETRLNELSNKI